MICKRCGSHNTVIADTREKEWGIKRTRECLDCGYRMPTIEVTEITDAAVKSLQKSNRIQRHKRQKGEANGNLPAGAKRRL